MIETLNTHIPQLDSMKKYPKEIFYIGNTPLLQNQMVSIVGTRKPNQYTKQFTYELASKLSSANITIVSGAAMGVDAIAHNGASASNTIAVAGTGLDIRYPAVNNNLIKDIEQKGLILSCFKPGTPSTRYNFPIRNEIVVALGEVLIVTQADQNSGTMRSVEYALKMGKDIFVLPHRLDESMGTQKLLQENKAKPIYDIDSFVDSLKSGSKISCNSISDMEQFFLSNPTYDEAMQRYPSEVFSYELSGKIEVINGKVIVKGIV